LVDVFKNFYSIWLMFLKTFIHFILDKKELSHMKLDEIFSVTKA